MVKSIKYYTILGIEPTAEQEAVRKAYRKLSLKWHPDKNPNNKDEADAMFKQIAEAYEILKDPETRRIYDMHGDDAFRSTPTPPSASTSTFSNSYQHRSTQNMPGFGFHFRNPNDIFREFFGERDPFQAMFGDMHGQRPAQPFGFGFAPHNNMFFDSHADIHQSVRNNVRRTQPNLNTLGGFPFGDLFGGDPFFNNSSFVQPGNFNSNFATSFSSSSGLGSSTKTSVQIINGQKFQTIEERDAQGNVKITQIGPDGIPKVTSNASNNPMIHTGSRAKELPKIPKIPTQRTPPRKNEGSSIENPIVLDSGGNRNTNPKNTTSQQTYTFPQNSYDYSRASQNSQNPRPNTTQYSTNPQLDTRMYTSPASNNGINSPPFQQNQPNYINLQSVNYSNSSDYSRKRPNLNTYPARNTTSNTSRMNPSVGTSAPYHIPNRTKK